MNVFVAAAGNEFMRDIAGWIVEAATLSGRAAVLIDDRLPAVDGSVNLVVAPHEFFELYRAPKAELQRAAAASVCICTEQPGTKWFDLTLDVARLGLRAYDINQHGVDALRAAGVDAHRLLLGAVPSMTAPATGEDRPIDVLFMGALDDRRGAVLADLAPALAPWRSELRLFRFDRPVSAATPGLVFGAEKYELLASARTLLNVHRGRPPLPDGTHPPAYFEWARMVEAMANRCVVVTEPSEGCAPLQAGVHFIEASLDEMPKVLSQALDDPAELRRFADHAFSAVTGELALATSVGSLLDDVEREVLPHLSSHVSKDVSGLLRWRLGASHVAPPVRLTPFKPHFHSQRKLRRIAMAENEALRQIDATRCLLRHGALQHVVRVETPAFADAKPDVTVVVSVYNYADVVEETLDSIVASTDVPFEVIVVDDHATDASRSVVTAYLEAHEAVPMVLLGKDANEGLSMARNTAFGEARADLVMVVDADNALFPQTLRKLADALRADPAASAAYGMLEEFGDARNLRSALAWDPQRLCVGNFIDAQAMIRRSAWKELGGYKPDDERIHGWEDWDLWLSISDRGGHARLVPEILGRYRVQAGSMIALTNLANDDALQAMRERHPRLPWPPLPIRK